jgi:hypothetical protein
MVKHMLKRQIVEDILSMTFLINFVLILGVVVAFSLIFITDYQGQMDDYAVKSVKNEKNLRQLSEDPRNGNAYANMQLIMKPRAERFISLSYEDRSPQGFYFRMWPYELRVLSKKEDVSGAGYYIPVTTREFVSPPTIFSPDLTFIVQFLLSFFAIILAFNAVTGEKEVGTLRLIYANPTKRAHFLVMKYLSALLTLGLPLLLSLTIAALMMFAFLSFLYLSVFVLIGLLCSTVTRSSKQSLVLGLLVWISLVVILPKSPGLLLNLKRFDVPTGEQIEGQVQKVSQDLWGKYEKEVMALRKDEAAMVRLIDKVEPVIDQAQQEVRDQYLRDKIAAILTLRKVTVVSPSSLYEYAASAVAGTGIFHFENFWTQARRFGDGFISYVKRISGDQKASTPFEFSIESITDKPIDYNAIPKFEEQNIRTGERLKDALPYVAFLVLYNLVLFAFIFYKFQKYDVR